MASSQKLTREALNALVGDIVIAHVSNNAVTTAELPELITSVYSAFDSLGKTPVGSQDKLKPAVAIHNSIKPDYIVCLEDGRRLKMLKRYLRTKYGLSPQEYRVRWGLPTDYPMIAPNYSERRSELAKQTGLGRGAGKKTTKRKPATQQI